MASSSRPIQDIVHPEEGKKTTKKAMKRPAPELSPAPLAVKKQKIQESSPKRGQGNGPSSSTTAASEDAMPCQATSALTHVMVLKNVWTAELLNLLGEFLCRRCRRVRHLTPEASTTLLRAVDMLMVHYRTHWKPFLCPGSVVFLYMVCRDSISAEVASKKELYTDLLICFYISCAYISTNVGYPAQPFMLERNSQAFWKRTLDITKRMSHKMLQINISPQFFAQVLADLKNRTDS